MKVSVCIPTYNCKDHLKRLIESLLKQNFTDYEVIIADDSTNNEIEDYIKELNEEKINYTHNIKRLGHIFNWNKVIDDAKGEYVKIMFADDWFNSDDALGKYVKMLDDDPEAVMAFSSNIQFYIEHPEKNFQRHIKDEFVKELRDDYRYVFVENSVGAPSGTIFRRSTGARFDEKSTYTSDIFLYIELLKNGGKFAYTDEPLVCIGIHEDQYTNNFNENVEKTLADRKYLYEKYALYDCPKCKEHFKNEFLLKFLQSPSYAEECGFDKKEYAKELKKAKKKRFLFYVGVAKRKLGLSKKEG
ncbi:MAG: glycosyltransferase [Lachnospiraceae bacterium]|nr:glycosyltransferase [Lachnospiraceae bacterium]